ncbi:hypothetical protein [Mitsuokella sp.]|uniref:hypothetical protein n=1 Tax=Mitsuokella sp. TaxID=2049034 RepID=UPI003D7CAD8F
MMTHQGRACDYSGKTGSRSHTAVMLTVQSILTADIRKSLTLVWAQFMPHDISPNGIDMGLWDIRTILQRRSRFFLRERPV